MKGTLADKTVWVTRARLQAAELSSLLRAHGARVVELPAIEIAPPADWTRLDAALDNLAGYDWLLFTSVNGVTFFFERLSLRHSLEPLRGVRIGAIGPATAEAIRRRGLRVEVLPERFQAEGLVEALSKSAGQIRGKRFLVPRAEQARSVLPEALRRGGARVDVIAVYRAVVPESTRSEIGRAFSSAPPDIVTFTSSSTVRNFVQLATPELLRQILDRARVAVIGAITAETAEQLGLRVAICAQRFTIPDLVEAIVRFEIGKGEP